MCDQPKFTPSPIQFYLNIVRPPTISIEFDLKTRFEPKGYPAYARDLTPPVCIHAAALMLCRGKLLTALVRLQPNIKEVTSSVGATRLLQSCRVVFEDESKKITVLTMPMLSPTMTEASLLHWLKTAGEKLEPYDLVFELETESLTEDAYKVGDFAGTNGI